MESTGILQLYALLSETNDPVSVTRLSKISLVDSESLEKVKAVTDSRSFIIPQISPSREIGSTSLDW